MAKITILEKDLTKASFQISPEDVVFVPGFSIKDDATTDLTYCETINEFEEKFGTSPLMLDDTYVISTKENVETSIDLSVYTSQYQSSMELVCKEVTVSDEPVLKWFTKIHGKEVEKTLSSLGITISPNNPTAGDKLIVNPIYDMSYVYAKELLMAGLPIVYQVVDTSTKTYDGMIDALKNNFIYDYTTKDGIMDKGEYSIKYVTSGGYPSFFYTYEDNVYNFDGSFAQTMLTLAGRRGDCVALIDPDSYSAGALPYIFTDNDGALLGESYNVVYSSDIDEFSYLGDGSLWEAAKAFSDNADFLEYGSMFSPWGYFYTQANYYDVDSDELILDLSKVVLPPSFSYLITLAKSVRNNGNWLAVAGTSRGQVPYYGGQYTYTRLSNNTANEMQPRNGKTSINAITNIKPYGYTIWGNRTMKNNEDNSRGGTDGLTATSFLNIRNMVSDVKKTAYNAAKQCMFEQNSDVLWVNFCSLITPLLDRLMSGQGLSNYKIIKNPTTEKAKLKATIKLYPIYAVEDFDITIELSDEDVSVV